MKIFEAFKFLSTLSSGKSFELIKIGLLNVFVMFAEVLLLIVFSKLLNIKDISLIELLGFEVSLNKIVVFSIIALIAVIYVQFRISLFANNLGQEIGNIFLRNYLFGIQRKDAQLSSATVMNSIVVEGNRIALKIVQPLLDISSRVILLVGLTGFALWGNFGLTVKILVVVLLLYVLFIASTSNFLKKISKKFSENNKNRIALIQEAVAHSIDIKLYARQNFILPDFKKYGRNLARITTSIHIIGITPKLLIEYLLVSGICLLYIFNGNMNNLLSANAAVFLALFRMLPVLHQLYNNISILRGNWHSLVLIKHNVGNLGVKITEIDLPSNWSKLSFENIKKEFHIKDISKVIKLESWSLELKKVGLYGIFGPSGSGKTTVAGIITGFIEADGGTVLMDNFPVQLFANKNWFDQVSFIQQSPILLNGSIIDNVAFAVSEKKPNIEKIKSCLIQAGISGDKELKNINRGVGEYGSELSGGQKQRIALARVLYSDCKVIVMDEPTSGLDPANEKIMLETLKILSKSHCIIIISHSTLLKDNLKFNGTVEFTI